MTRKDALWKVAAAIKSRGLDADEFWVSDEANGACPAAVSLVRALEALGLIKFDERTEHTANKG